MPIIEATGSIFDCPATVLVSPVNCEGTMGAGLAREFARRYPDVEQAYIKHCRNGQVVIGHVNLYPVGNRTRVVACFPTKYKWKEPSRIEYIIGGLRSLVSKLDDNIGGHNDSIAIPALGCGLGGLSWSEVKPLIVQAFAQIPDVTVYIFAPQEDK